MRARRLAGWIEDEPEQEESEDVATDEADVGPSAGDDDQEQG